MYHPLSLNGYSKIINAVKRQRNLGLCGNLIFNLYSTVCLFNFNCKCSACIGWLTHTLLTVSAKWMFRLQITHVEVEVEISTRPQTGDMTFQKSLVPFYLILHKPLEDIYKMEWTSYLLPVEHIRCIQCDRLSIFWNIFNSVGQDMFFRFCVKRVIEPWSKSKFLIRPICNSDYLNKYQTTF